MAVDQQGIGDDVELLERGGHGMADGLGINVPGVDRLGVR